MDSRTRSMCRYLEKVLTVPNPTYDDPVISPSGALRIVGAFGWRQRMVGLLGRRRLHPRAGLWLRPCHAVHTFGMAFPISVVFLDKSDRCVKLVVHLLPNRVVVCLSAHSAVELATRRDAS